ncbi:ycgL [Acrasis kona]|uniref:YcgL n=1 Tax=Acrasis kona TaxID=1008807 RepID=A0AAW2YIS3_9EUKA
MEHINRILKKVELDNDIRILFASETGSRSTGLAAPDSDWDVKAIYIHKLDWYLKVEENTKTELALKSEVDETDLHAYELRRALRLMKNGNPTLIETLFSSVVYYSVPDVTQELQELMSIFYNRKTMAYHYVNIVKQNVHQYIYNRELVNRKKYIYILQYLLRGKYLIEHHDDPRTLPPLNLDELISQVQVPQELLSILNELITRKRSASGQWEKEPPISLVDDYIVKLRTDLKAHADKILSNEPRYIDTLSAEEQNQVEARMDNLIKKCITNFENFN